MSRETILTRIGSICAGAPFNLVEARTWADFDKEPNSRLEGLFRVTVEQQETLGGSSFSEEVTDLFSIWIARKSLADPLATRTRLLTDVGSLRAAIVRDGATGGGDYAVVDGGASLVDPKPRSDYTVGRLSVPINYEVQL